MTGRTKTRQVVTGGSPEVSAAGERLAPTVAPPAAGTTREMVATAHWPPVAIPGRPGWYRHLVDGGQVDSPEGSGNPLERLQRTPESLRFDANETRFSDSAAGQGDPSRRYSRGTSRRESSVTTQGGVTATPKGERRLALVRGDAHVRPDAHDRPDVHDRPPGWCP